MGISLLEEVVIPTFLADFIMATLQLFQSHGQTLSEAEVFVRSQETLSQMTVSLIGSILIQIGQETNDLNGIVHQVADCPSMTIVLISHVFFFQAEDGIRDWSVTGVQTCALPISSRRRHTRLVSDWSSDVCSSD